MSAEPVQHVTTPLQKIKLNFISFAGKQNQLETGSSLIWRAMTAPPWPTVRPPPAPPALPPLAAPPAVDRRAPQPRGQRRPTPAPKQRQQAAAGGGRRRPGGAWRRRRGSTPTSLSTTRRRSSARRGRGRPGSPSSSQVRMFPFALVGKKISICSGRGDFSRLFLYDPRV